MKTEITNEKAENQAAVSVSVTDLRIGNKIIDKSDEVNEVIGIVNGAVFLKNKYEFIGCPVSWCKPILLTEKWLLNLGFESGGANNWLFMNLDKNDTSYLYFNPLGSGIAIEENRQECSLNIKIEYVHQLQNLYFYLTGSELQISSITEH